MTRTVVSGSRGAVARAYAALVQCDPVLRGLVEAVGRPDPVRWDGGAVAGDDLFAGLALHIVGQQISIPAALTIFGRLGDASGASSPSAGALAALDLGQLRAAGLSAAKSRALHGLATGVVGGTIDLDALRAVDDAAAIELLCSLRGVGPWSAQMFLIHQLQRPDVLPAGDIGIRHAVHRAYGLPERPSEREVVARSAAWAPYRSYAAALLWASATS